MKIGLALSGGGIRGIAHAGALKALEDNKIKIDMIAGTSSGSLVAALYALKYSPYNIYMLFKKYAKELIKIDVSALMAEVVINKTININGLNSGEAIENTYNEIAIKKGITKLSQINMPLLIPTVDISNSKEYVFTSVIPNGNYDKYITDATIGKAVRASASFPGVFIPCKYKNHLFVDGGVLDNIPAIELQKFGADKIISIKFDSDTVNKNSNIMDIIMKVIDIMGNKVSEKSLNISNYIITIPSDGTGLLETNKIDYCYKSGYDTVIRNIEPIKKILNL